MGEQIHGFTVKQVSVDFRLCILSVCVNVSLSGKRLNEARSYPQNIGIDALGGQLKKLVVTCSCLSATTSFR